MIFYQDTDSPDVFETSDEGVAKPEAQELTQVCSIFVF